MARCDMWGLKLVALVVGLLVMVPETMQLSPDHHLYRVVQRMNENEGPLLGMVLSDSDSDEKLFHESGYFVPREDNPTLVISGRTFYIGKFRGMNAVAVRGYGPMANVAVTCQILIETFKLLGIVTYGKAGSTSDKLELPNVAVPSNVAYTGVWTWQWEQHYEKSLRPDDKALATLKIGDYNLPTPGENKLAGLEYGEVTKYTPKGSTRSTFWFYVDPNWLDIANEIEGSDLQECIGGKMCSDEKPVLVHGLNLGSSDIFVDNTAYGNFLNEKLKIDAVDTMSAAVVSTAVANNVPHIVFRGASNKPGVKWDDELKALAGRNVLEVVRMFVDRLAQKVQPYIAKY